MASGDLPITSNRVGPFRVGRHIGVFQNAGTIFVNSSSGPAIETIADGEPVMGCIDVTNQLVWFSRLGNPGVWNGSGTANPATGNRQRIRRAGHASFRRVTQGNFDRVANVNFGASSYINSAPPGFSNFI